MPRSGIGVSSFRRNKFSFGSLAGTKNNLIVSNGVVSGYEDSSNETMGSLRI